MKKPYTLYKRHTTKKNKYVYYIQFRNANGNRMTAVSSGQTSKTSAEAWAIKQLQEGMIKSTKDLKFSVFAQDWFVWGKCKYLERQLNRREDYSRRHADDERTLLKNHILPYFSNHRLSEITVNQIENWLLSVKDRRSSSTVNHALSTLKIMLGEAHRLGIINRNPVELVKRLRETPKKRNILTIDEAQSLFHPESLISVWEGNLFHFTLNLIACVTGMRMGEIQALHREDFREDYLTISHSWDRKYGLKSPKNASERIVPLSHLATAKLRKLISMNGVTDSGGLIFYDETKHTPIYCKVIQKYFYQALTKIGITEKERKYRNITFHSWRHYFNSFMRYKVPDSKLQKVTGHRTMRMTEHYYHQQIEDLEEVREVQETMII